MNSRKNLAAQVAGAMAIAALVGTSAFAESRHSDATERDHGRQSSSDRGSRDRAARSGSETQTESRHETTAPQTYQRSETRSNGSWNRNETRNNSTFDRSQTRSSETWNRSNNNRSFDRSQAESFRNNNRSYDRSQSYRSNRPQYDNRGRRSDFVEGRVSRFVHERGGYRIWVDGGRFPVWIPEARIGLFPHLRIGLSLRFGGYYDPLGYLEAYDYYNDGYGYGGAYSSGLLRGVVETVDYRRGTLVLRDDVSGSFVTTLIRDRRLETLRPGDYAEIAGDWTRSGVFEGLRLEDTRYGRY
ncbi:MAG: hypothetical protein JO093_10800 [Acidobacteria bacterium]|nr:hypothetical protein [Acidobacteriota bacterium]MBV9186106.1 hypothetical protein [Acidobacteriota bacterium]